MKRAFVLFSLLVAVLTASALTITSPDGHLQTVVSVRDNQVSYSVMLDGHTLLSDSRAALELRANAENAVLRPLGRVTKKSDNQLAFAYRQKRISTEWNEQTFRLTSVLNIEFRVYNDGVAYRFVQTNRKPQIIEKEVAVVSPSSDIEAYVPYSTNEQKPEAMAFQNIYTKGKLSELKDQWAFLPVTLDMGGGVKITLLESDLEAYPGLFVRPTEGKLVGVQAKYPRKVERGKWRGMTHVAETEDYIAKTKGARTFPWRILCITGDDCQMPTSDLVYALASPNRAGDISWIKPGKSAWDWWHNWNLKGVPFKAGINMETYKYYIDFAAKYGLQYAILDEGWYNSNRGELMQSIPEIDVKQLVDYGRQKGVGIILWTVFNVLDEHLEAACSKYASMGVKGFKVDFLDRDDQTAVEMAYRIAEACARHHLILDYHGFYKPTGLNRTYPNVVNIESVFGMEEVKWNNDKKDMPLYDVTFPFIRGMAGFVDYTPGAMRNGTKDTYAVVYTQPISMGTRCHQLAAYVVHDSPLTMLADAASSYEAEPAYTRFLASIPNDVDETHVIAGKLGEYIVVARRAGDTWWIGGQTNWDARDLTLNLQTSLGIEGKHHITLYADGLNADNNAEDFVVQELEYQQQPLTVHLASGGGFVMKLQ